MALARVITAFQQGGLSLRPMAPVSSEGCFLIALAGTWQDFAMTEAPSKVLSKTFPHSGTHSYPESLHSSPNANTQLNTVLLVGHAGTSPGAHVQEKGKPCLR